jgi:hypothetical protein
MASWFFVESCSPPNPKARRVSINVDHLLKLLVFPGLEDLILLPQTDK